MKGKPEHLSQDFIEHLKSKGFSFIGDISQSCKCNWAENEKCEKCKQKSPQ